MTNRRSYLDAMNAGRRRRAGTSLEQLNDTLAELESRIRRPHDDRDADYGVDRSGRRSFGSGHPFHAASQQDHRLPRLANELGALREELRQQMGSGLRREFAALRGEIERALDKSDGVHQAAELSAEFERLSGMIHKLAEQSDDRQIDGLRAEMEEVKRALGKLAREETLQSFDRRWDEFDRRWSDIATKVSSTQHRGAAGDHALQALTERLEQIGDAVNALPTSVALRSLEEKMKILSVTVDQFAHQQDRIGPEALDAIEERLNEISRAVAASAPVAQAGSFDPEPFERIEARISSLARQLGSVIDDHPVAMLADQLAELAHRVEDLARQVNVPDQTVARLVDQIDVISRKMDETPARPDLDLVFSGLEQRFASLSAMLEQRHDDALAQGQSLFRDLERRLDDVTSRIEVKEAAGAGETEQFLRVMDDRFSELTARLEHRQAAPDPASVVDPELLRKLESQLAGDSEHLLRAMDDRFAEIAARLERQQAASTPMPGVDPELIRSLEAQVAGLAAHIASTPTVETGDLSPRLDKIERSIVESRADVVEAARRAAEEAVRSITASADTGAVAGLADDLKALETLARRSDDRNARTFEAIHDTLIKIVERLGTLESERVATARSEAGLRDRLVDTPSVAPGAEAFSLAPLDDEDEPELHVGATAAAPSLDRAKGDAVAAEPASGRKSMLGGLTRALSGRKTKQDTAARKSEPAPVMPRASDLEFDGVAVEVDAPIDPQIANQPLEPGSGAPDLNAIMKRVRGERTPPVQGADAETAKSDFIAAARRAAQAAAAEAEMSKRAPVARKGAEGLGFGRLLGTRRKPLLMGVAIIALGLAGYQASGMFLQDGERAPEAQPAPSSEQTAAIPERSAPDQLVAEQLAPDLPAPDLPAPDQPVRIAGENSAADAAHSLLATPPQSAEDVTAAWLDASAAAPLAAEMPQDDPAAIAETDMLAEPSEEMLASIPLSAGPVALREAAAAGDPKALFEIGNRYAEGRGVTEDMAAAAQWYEKAAEHGLAPAQYRIGNLYEKGVGVARDVSRAKTWYQLAAGQGNASAMHNLAVLHAMGADGVTDNDSAARWFIEAAELGVRDSQFNLGILTAKGVGTPQNLEEAYKWFALVAKAGDNDAAAKRDEIASLLAPEGLERARAATELWRAKPVDPEANTVEIPDSWNESSETTASVDMREALRNIQQILNASGYDAGTEDGLMGQRTRNAIAKFQKDNGMSPSGEVDEPLVHALLERR